MSEQALEIWDLEPSTNYWMKEDGSIYPDEAHKDFGYNEMIPCLYFSIEDGRISQDRRMQISEEQVKRLDSIAQREGISWGVTRVIDSVIDAYLDLYQSALKFPTNIDISEISGLTVDIRQRIENMLDMEHMTANDLLDLQEIVAKLFDALQTLSLDTEKVGVLRNVIIESLGGEEHRGDKRFLFSREAVKRLHNSQNGMGDNDGRL